MRKPSKASVPTAGWIRILRMLVAAAVGYLLVQVVQVQVSIYRQQRTLEELTIQCLDQEAENASVERYLSMEDNTQLVEQIAREKLGFAYPDEVVFIDAAGS